MKKEIIVSAKTIDDQLYNLYLISLDFIYSEEATQRTAYVVKVANETIHWYIGTARASAEFLKVFVNLSKHRLRTLIKKCIAADAGTEMDAIKAIKAYMKVDAE